MTEKSLYIIAGCNGAGKTTASFTILPEIIDCQEFVNADEIARGISPFQPEKVAFEAGRIMLNRINELIGKGETFAFETTLATKSHIHKIRQAKQRGYSTTLLFFWLESIELAKERVRIRVKEGGHNIRPKVIERRYNRGIKNLFDIFIPEVNGLLIIDNSSLEPELIAKKSEENGLEMINEVKFQQIKRYYENYK